MNIEDIEALARLKESQTISIFNPLDEDFVVNWDSKPLKPAKRLNFTEYPYHEGKHVFNALKQAVINKRKIKPTDFKEIEEIEKEICDAI